MLYSAVNGEVRACLCSL